MLLARDTVRVFGFFARRKESEMTKLEKVICCAGDG
jgi:hypothetical protein